MKQGLLFCFLLSAFKLCAQPAELAIGLKRNEAQTLMGKAKIESYEKGATKYLFAEGVTLTIEFDKNELCKGFYWFGKNENTLEKTIIENGFTKRDSLSFIAKNLQGFLKKEKENTAVLFRFIPSTAEQRTDLQSNKNEEQAEKEKPFSGMTILGMKVWEKKEKEK